MGTTASTVSTAINELDTRLDSINDTLINTAKLHMRDSSATNTVKGNLNVHSNVDIGSSYGPREQGSYAAEFYTAVKTAYISSGMPA